ncbi:MAG: PIN domain-containing protein [Candidatus Omnitrophica bacterium]|nr:PIN domain-containing protein [Candidatus Omnitrophota bacterium]
MDTRVWQVFLDSSVIVSGMISQIGASSAILDLGEAGEIKIILSKGVLVETDRVFERKFPALLGDFREFIKNLSPVVINDPTFHEIQVAKKVIDQGDAIILAAAKKVNLHSLISLDTKHFHTSKVKLFLKAPVLTPAQFLKEFRQIYEC